MPRFSLSESGALEATLSFVDRYRASAGDDLSTLWADTRIRVGRRGTADPAAWYDWVQCLSEATRRDVAGPMIDEIQSFHLLTELIDWALGHFGERLAVFHEELAKCVHSSERAALLTWKVWDDRFAALANDGGLEPARGESDPDIAQLVTDENLRLDANGALRCVSHYIECFITRAGNDFRSLVNDLGSDFEDMNRSDPGAWSEWRAYFAEEAAAGALGTTTVVSPLQAIEAMRRWLATLQPEFNDDLRSLSDQIASEILAPSNNDSRLHQAWAECLILPTNI